MKMYIEENYPIKDLSEASSLSPLKLYLYGAGEGVSSYSRIALAALRHHGIEPLGFIDDDVKKHGLLFSGVRIFSPEKVIEDKCNLILVSSNYFTSILGVLEKIKYLHYV